MSALAAQPPLNYQQKAFVAEYLKCRNAKQAYLHVYRNASIGAAESAGTRLLSDVRVQALMAESGNRLLTGAVLSLAEKRAFLHMAVHTNAADVDGSHILCTGIKRTESGPEYKMPDKMAALMLDARLAGELKEQPAVVVATPLGSVLAGLMGTGAQVLDGHAETVGVQNTIQDAPEDDDDCV